MNKPSETFTCAECRRELPASKNCGTGYSREALTDNLICYDCCAVRDARDMGYDGKIILYLTDETIAKTHGRTWKEFYVCNWPNTLRFRCIKPLHKSTHNIAGKRYDAWFIGPDGAVWHGVSFGDSEICRCNRLKRQKKHLTPLPQTSYLKPFPYENISNLTELK